MTRRAAAIVGVLAVGTFLGRGVAGAAGDGANQQSQLAAQIGVESQAEAAALSAIKVIQDKRTVIDARVADLDGQLSAAEATVTVRAAEAERLAAIAQEIGAQVAVTQARLDEAQLAFDASAAQEYRSARTGAGYEQVLAAQPDDLVRQDNYLAHVSAKRHRLVERVAVLRRELERQHRAAQDNQAKADATAADARAARDQVGALRAEIEPARAEAAQQQAAEEAALADIEARLGAAEAELASLQAASDSISVRLRRNPLPGQAGRCEARPVPGSISGGFGSRIDPIRGGSGFHPGVDMNASYGEPIYACRGGTVVIASAQGGYGNAVVIDHGGGMATLYGHQSRLGVSENQHVSAGDVIGYVGSTGYSTGPHLHFEVRIAGNPVDPARYL